MNNIIKCPICHEMSGLRYNENRVYQSRCQNMACRETVTVTAPSGKAAEELFSKFEEGTNQPKLSIPKKIAEWLDAAYEEHRDQAEMVSTMLTVYIIRHASESETISNWFMRDKNFRLNLATAYLASKALCVELVEVIDE